MTNIITLPEPQKDLDFPLMKAIEMRRTKRKWQDSNLSDQEISNILCAACGIIQEETKRSKSKSKSTAVLGIDDKDKLHKIMGLSENEKVVYTQVIGKSLIWFLGI